MRIAPLLAATVLSLGCQGADSEAPDSGSPGDGEAMIVATSGAEAIEAGLQILDEGGSAVDAAIAVANVQIVRSGGSWNSFAGILGGVFYDAETRPVPSLHGNYATFAGEVDPLTIPAGAPSGRTALVPGYMAAAEAAHARYGRLPWERLFEPAIALAEDGWQIDGLFAYYLQWKAEVLRRRAETEAIFTDADGELLVEGDLFQQPALAETLRAVSAEGAAYMYTGDWAERFVQAVAEEGGAADAADLAAYEPAWLDPLEGSYAGHRIHTIGAQEFGGVQILEGLHMAEAMALSDLGPPTGSGEALYRIARISQVNHLWTWLYDYAPEHERYVTDAFPGIALDHASRVDPAQGALMAQAVDDGTFAAFVD